MSEFEPIIKKLEENNDSLKLRLLTENFICDYEDIIHRNIYKSNFAFSKVIDTLQRLRVQTQELLNENWASEDASSNSEILKKIETVTSRMDSLIKAGGIKCRKM